MSIRFLNPATKDELFYDRDVLSDSKGNRFPLTNGAYRLTGLENYTSSFGFQWNKFVQTQIDRDISQCNQSRERFFIATKWDKENLKGKNILEVGSGAGRFTNIVLKYTEANLYSVDYSNAVEANYKNNGPNPRLKLFQASIYELPFFDAQFDKVFCFGVLQHTPDFSRAVECLVKMVKPGGELVVDFYPVKGWYTRLTAKYLLRPLTCKMDHQKLLELIESNVDRLITLYNFNNKVGIGKIVNRFVPICDIRTTIPHNLDYKALREWVILDTFDMFSPAYDNPQKISKVVNWFIQFGMKNVEGELIQYGDSNTVTVVKGNR